MKPIGYLWTPEWRTKPLYISYEEAQLIFTKEQLENAKR
jgi:hypothetical protein